MAASWCDVRPASSALLWLPLIDASRLLTEPASLSYLLFIANPVLAASLGVEARDAFPATVVGVLCRYRSVVWGDPPGAPCVIPAATSN
jgi:hypothetical protein